jgi:hypothetical protein
MARAAHEFDEWFRLDYRRVLGSVLVVCAGDVQRAEDATNQAFMKAYEQWHKVLLVDSRRAWVTKVAINAAKRSFMSRRRVEPLNVDAVLYSTDDAWVDHQLWETVNRLSVGQREAAVLRYIDAEPSTATTNELYIFELIDRVETNLVAPAAMHVREAATRRSEARHGKVGAAGLLVVLVVILGGGLWLSGAEPETSPAIAKSPSTSTTAPPQVAFEPEALGGLVGSGARRVISNSPAPAIRETLSHVALDRIDGQDESYVLWVSNGCEEKRFLASRTAESLTIGPELQPPPNVPIELGDDIAGTTNHYRSTRLACAPTSFPRVIDSRIAEGTTFDVGVLPRNTTVLRSDTLESWTISAQRAQAFVLVSPNDR